DHTADETTDRAIGLPATVVYAEELSETALLEGLRKGHAYVRVRGVGGPSIRFDASSGSESWQMGDVVPGSVAQLTLKAILQGASGERLQWIRNGEVISMMTVGTAPLTLDAKPNPGDWFSIVLRDEKGPT